MKERWPMDSAEPDYPAGAGGYRLGTPLTLPPIPYSRVLMEMAFSPDGRLLAVATGDGRVPLWDPASAENLRTVSGAGGSAYALAFSPDGRLLAVGGDGGVSLWDPATAEHRRTLRGHSGEVRGVAFGPDGRLLASAGSDGTVRLWDLASGEILHTMTGRTDRVSWPPWRSATGENPRTVIADSFARVRFGRDGRLLAVGSRNGSVRLWDPADGGEPRTLTGHAGSVDGLAFSPGGRLLASGGDTTVRLWDPATGENLHVLSHGANVCGLAFSPGGRLLASACEDRTARLWDPVGGKLLHTVTGHMDMVFEVAFSPGGRLLATGTGDGVVKLWPVTPAS
jgi:WD40 repeat protein